MKTFKIFITLLLLTIGMAAQAQQKVVIELNDGTSEAYDLADVDSVTYEPKEVVKYYFYAGWELPKTKEELVKLAKEPNGGEVKINEYSTGQLLREFSGELTTSTRSPYYFVIPNGFGLYDGEGSTRLEELFETQTEISIPNHTVYKYPRNASNIAGYMIKKI